MASLSLPSSPVHTLAGWGLSTTPRIVIATAELGPNGSLRCDRALGQHSSATAQD